MGNILVLFKTLISDTLSKFIEWKLFYNLDEKRLYIGTGDDNEGLPKITDIPTKVSDLTNDTGFVTQSAVDIAVTSLVNSSPATLDTLSELATALGNDPNFATTITTLVGTKAPLASPALTGTPTAPTPATADNTTKLATTAYVKSQSYAPLASPALTGTPTAPTATAGTNTTQVATTAFVLGQGFIKTTDNKTMDGGTF